MKTIFVYSITQCLYCMKKIYKLLFLHHKYLGNPENLLRNKNKNAFVHKYNLKYSNINS